jgi:hypothetical protein
MQSPPQATFNTPTLSMKKVHSAVPSSFFKVASASHF